MRPSVTPVISDVGTAINNQHAYLEALLEVVRGDGVASDALFKHARRSWSGPGLPDFTQLCDSALQLTGDAELGIKLGVAST